MDSKVTHGKAAIETMTATEAKQQSDPFVELRGEFDSLLARMQTPAAAKAGRELFDADAGALGKAALKGVRRKRS